MSTTLLAPATVDVAALTAAGRVHARRATTSARAMRVELVRRAGATARRMTSLVPVSVRRFAAFGASSLASTGVDWVLVLGLNALTGWLFVPVAVARIVSCAMNFAVNLRLLGTGQETRADITVAAVRYGLLALTVMLASYLAIKVLVWAGLALWLAKVFADGTLFLVNYTVQRTHVYARR